MYRQHVRRYYSESTMADLKRPSHSVPLVQVIDVPNVSSPKRLQDAEGAVFGMRRNGLRGVRCIRSKYQPGSSLAAETTAWSRLIDEVACGYLC